jgi:type I restriction enzyme, S subunit
MSDLPVGWEKLPLSEIAAGTFNVDPSGFPQEIFELYSVPSFSTGVPDQVRGNEIKSSKQMVEPGDVLLCKIVPHLNRVWTVGAKGSHRQIASGEWIVYRDHNSNPDYLRYCLSEGSFRDQFMTTVAGVGGSLMRARPSEVAKIEIPLAPYAEQHRIVAKIDSLSAKSGRARDHLDHLPRLVEKYKQGILAAGFRGELTREWREARGPQEHPQPTKLLSERSEFLLRTGNAPRCSVDVQVDVADPPPYHIPASWRWVRAESLSGFITKGTTPAASKMTSAKGGIPFIKVYNLTFQGDLVFSIDPTFISAQTHRGELKRSIVTPGDVLMNIVGPPLGKVSIVPGQWPEWNINQAIAVFKPIPSLDAKYLSRWLLSEILLRWATSKAKATAGQSNLTLEICRDLPISLCSLAEQQQINRLIDIAFAWVTRLASETVNARKLIDHLDQSVLAKAFRGELVPQDPNDEPASVLLERIRAARATTTSAARPTPRKNLEKIPKQAKKILS